MIFINFYSINALDYLIGFLFKFHLLAPATNNIDEDMVMGIIFKISLFLFIISEILRYLFLKFTNYKIIIRTKYKIIISLVVILIIFLLAILSFWWAKLSNENDRGVLILIIIFFYGLSSITTLIYFSINPLVLFFKNIWQSKVTNKI